MMGDSDPVEQKEFFKRKTFPEILKYQRELRGWSQAKMAEGIGATPNRVSSWERGVALPSAYFREKLCLCLNMNAEELGLLTASTSKEPPHHPQEDKQRPEEETSALPTQPEAPSASEQQQPQKLSIISPQRFATGRWIAILFLVLTGMALGSLFIMSFYGSFVPGQMNPYPPNAGRLILDDLLHDQSNNVNWQEGTNDQQASCVFKEGGYVAFQPHSGYFHACMAQKVDYTNFAYEVLMTIQQGEFGGIIFRAEDSIDVHYYLFRVGTDGSYWLYRFVDRAIEHATLLDHGSAQNFNRGLGKTNSLAVVTQGSSLTLYINRQEVSALQDAGYTHGQIGVLAGSLDQGPSQALFRNVKVWAW